MRWNVLPDIAPSLLKLSHFKKDIYDLVMARAEHLSKEGDNMSVEEYSKQLASSATSCPTSSATPIPNRSTAARPATSNMKSSTVYGYLTAAASARGRIPHLPTPRKSTISTALYEQINELHEQYSQLAPSYGVDFVFSLTACVDLLMGMLGAKTPGDCRGSEPGAEIT